MAFKVPPEYKSAKDLPKSWEPEPFGSRTEAQTRLAELLPGIKFNLHKDDLWGTYIGEGFSLEISLGKDEPMRVLWVAVRGDAKALSVIGEIVNAFGLRGLDLQCGEFFEPLEARKSFAEWRNAVDRFRKEKLGHD